MDHELLVRRDAQPVVAELDLDPQAAERRQDRDHVVRHDAVDGEVAVCDGCEADEAADLDVLGSDRPLPTGQPLDPVDAEDVRLDALDPGAERDQEAAEILHVRLTGSVPDRGFSGCDDSGHDRVLGRHHARLVEEDAGAAQPFRPHLVAALDLDPRTQPLKRVDVWIEPAPPDHVAARRRHARAAEPCEQRAGEQERCPDPLRENRVDLVGRESPGIDLDLVRSRPVRVRARAADDREHRLDVANPRDVRERHRLVGEQAGGEDRQGAVLVPRGANTAAERVSALDDEGMRGRRDGHAGLG